jgi:hypothetical protein
MREILFRGIILHPTDMFSGFWYGDLIQFADGTVGIRQQQTGTEMQVIPDSVGQFTGLLDKNGTRIFEGDKVSLNSIESVILWDEHAAMFRQVHGMYSDHLKVIENIHES